jgi:hypothetical protein
MSDVNAEPIVDPTAVIDPAATPVATPEPEAKPDTSWVPKRISEITAARRAAEARVAELEAELTRARSAPAANPGDSTPPPADIDKLARSYAEKLVRDQRSQETMSSRIAEIETAGAKEFGEDFQKSVSNLQMAGVGGGDFLRVLTSVPNPEKIVTWLGKSENLNEAMRVATMDPVQMGIELTKLSSRATKELGKQISKAPPPIQPIDGGSGGSDSVEPNPNDTKAWMAWRQKNKKSRR